MAFVESDLSAVRTVASNGKRFNVWIYDTADNSATVQGPGYFALAAATSGVFEEGEARLSEGDLIYVPTLSKIYRVSDADVGSVGSELLFGALT